MAAIKVKHPKISIKGKSHRDLGFSFATDLLSDFMQHTWIASYINLVTGYPYLFFAFSVWQWKPLLTYLFYNRSIIWHLILGHKSISLGHMKKLDCFPLKKNLIWEHLKLALFTEYAKAAKWHGMATQPTHSPHCWTFLNKRLFIAQFFVIGLTLLKTLKLKFHPQMKILSVKFSLKHFWPKFTF